MAGNGWQDMKLGEFVTLQRGHDLPEHQRRPGSVPILGSFGITGHHDMARTKGPGVTVGRSGASFGVVSYSPVDFWPLNTALYVKDFHGNDERFAYYFLKAVDFKRYNSGSAQPSLNRNYVHPIPVLVPPLAEQRVIAHILGTLDDKIELNRRMNETLEALARAIFKSWFVDFDPVRAKMDGRQPVGMDAETAKLFPDGFVESELGRIPRGWRVHRLADICSTQYGYTASAVPEPLGPKFLRVTDINKRNWIEWGDVPYCTRAPDATAPYSLEIGDIVVARMADPGKSAIIEDKIDAVFASYLVRLKTASLAHSYFVFGFLKSDAYFEYAAGARSGSVQANMNAKVIVGSSLVVPPTEILDKSLKVVLPLRQHITANVRQSDTLACLRNTLLPKLLSGEIRVPVAEKMVEEVL